jgi:hypothetical protein
LGAIQSIWNDAALFDFHGLAGSIYDQRNQKNLANRGKSLVTHYCY